MKCERHGCTCEAYCDVQWHTGDIGTTTATMCKEHSDELWGRLSPLVTVNLATYRVDQPGVIKSEGRT